MPKSEPEAWKDENLSSGQSQMSRSSSLNIPSGPGECWGPMVSLWLVISALLRYWTYGSPRNLLVIWYDCREQPDSIRFKVSFWVAIEIYRTSIGTPRSLEFCGPPTTALEPTATACRCGAVFWWLLKGGLEGGDPHFFPMVSYCSLSGKEMKWWLEAIWYEPADFEVRWSHRIHRITCL